MRRIVLVSIAWMIGFPTVSNAQTWSADEHALFAHVRDCWETKGLEDYDQTVATCNISEDIVYWGGAEAVPAVGLPWHYDTNGATFAELDLIGDDFRPLRVSRQGDTYLLFYIGIRLYRRPDGSRLQAQWKGLDVWERVGQEWHLVAGMDVELPS